MTSRSVVIDLTGAGATDPTGDVNGHPEEPVYRTVQGGAVEELVMPGDFDPTEPQECPRPHPPGYDRSQCLDCARRRRWVHSRAGDVLRVEHPVPGLTSLVDFLAVPDEPVPYLIEGVWPVGANVLLTAKEKTGKSTLMANLLRSLVDGEDFLDAHPVAEPVERVVLLDFELSEGMLRRWLRDQRIQAPDAVHVVAMRGKAQAFDVLDHATRARWAAHLGPGDVLLVDCLRPLIDALGLDENRDGSKVMQALSTLCAEAGIGSWLLVHHMGHHGERARGDSGLVGSADVLWRILREDQDKPMPQPTYFTAHGRDVDVREERLGYNPQTRRLTVVGGTRANARGDRDAEVLVAHLRTVRDPLPPWNQGVMVEQAKAALDCGDRKAQAAIDHAVNEGLIVRQRGTNNARMHCLSEAGAAP